jgi:hypothetical protein
MREGAEEEKEPTLGPPKPLIRPKNNANNNMHNVRRRQRLNAVRKAPPVKLSISPPSPKAKTPLSHRRINGAPND